MDGKVIIDTKTMLRTLARLSHEIIERNSEADEIYLIGIKRRGVSLAKIIKENIEKFSDIKVNFSEIDITFYRDDLTERYTSPRLNAQPEKLPIDGKTVVLVDDVIYTGRTARAAMEAVISMGRPAAIQLAVMIDRGHRELPINPN
ncbi:MAG: bifunctional pyr operon transcriptional regulator/uracil phosphoribosyltransferase PyrR, partial [Clostridiales bacterium]|nr:bifunctional pyr operon transcriptional regulator/uracil phosphoribosyltransferase PyrR [Clostridiales bacterium]